MSTDKPPTRRWDPGIIHTALDDLSAAYTGSLFKAEVAQAREEYFTRSGKVFEDDAEVYELRTLSFLEWYIIERPLGFGRPPIIDALEKAAAASALGTDVNQALACLASSHHSLFDIAHVDGGSIELEDVLGGARFRVAERRSTIGFEVGAIVEARVVWDGVQPVFAKTFLFHPKDARSEILDLVDSALAAGNDRDEIMFRLAQLYLRWHRHGHSNAARIYKGTQTVGPVPL